MAEMVAESKVFQVFMICDKCGKRGNATNGRDIDE